MSGKSILWLIVAIIIGTVLIAAVLTPLPNRTREHQAVPQPNAPLVPEASPPSGHTESPAPTGAIRPPRAMRPAPPVAIRPGPPLATLPGPTTETPSNPMSPERVDEALENLSWGNIAFTAPNSVQYESEHTIRLLLSQTIPIDDLREELADHVPIESARIQISNEMEATLTGVGFDITPITKEIQTVGREGRTEWMWSVVATKEGLRNLHLVLTAYIYLGEEKKLHTVATFERVIAVHVTIGQRFRAFWAGYGKWSIAIVLIPLFKGFRKWRRSRRARIGYE